jgi:hypothetical protein
LAVAQGALADDAEALIGDGGRMTVQGAKKHPVTAGFRGIARDLGPDLVANVNDPESTPG